MKQAGLGAFYTPKFISDFMSRRALYWYFHPSLKGTISETIEGFDDLLQGKKKSLFSDPVKKEQFEQQLRQLIILDPAVGSGMFLLSCAELLEKIYSHLDSDVQQHEKNAFNKDLRQNIVQEHLFGWDIDLNAIQVLSNMILKWINNQDISIYLNQNSIPHSELIAISELPTKLSPNFINQDALDIEEWLQPSKNVIIIGNPPFGNILPQPRKKELSKRYTCRSNEISELFVELGYRLIDQYNRGFLCFILPKTITYYQNWESCRKLIIQHSLLEIFDLGIAFPGVNLEQIAIIGTNHDPSIKEKGDFLPSINLFQFSPLKTPNKTEIKPNGTVPQNLLKTSNILIYSPISKNQSDLLLRIKENATFLDEIGKITRSIYISDKEKTTLQSGEILFLNKIPDLQAFSIKNLYNIQKKPEYEEFLRPKLIFKVLRGSRLSCFPDEQGLIFTTEKAVNVLLAETWKKHTYALTLFLNTRIPSFFLQATLYSQTTETSRVLDPFYARKIPLPEYQQDLYLMADLFCKMQILANSTGKLEMFKKLVEISEAIALFAYFKTDLDRFQLNEIYYQVLSVKTQENLKKLRNMAEFDCFNMNLSSILTAVCQKPPIEKENTNRKSDLSPIKLNIAWNQIEEILDQIYKDLRINAIKASWIHQEIYQLLGK